MLNTLLNLFGRSPFAPLASHMKTVSRCVYSIKDLFVCLENEEEEKLEECAQKIYKLERQADSAKNRIRNHLPKNLFLPVDRENLLEILSIQDGLADKAENIAVLMTLKKLKLFGALKEEVKVFLEKNFEAFEGACRIIKELHDLLETSFGGIEAEKVKTMVEDVAFKESEADEIQKKLLKELIKAENDMSYTTFFLWQRILVEVGGISDLSENLAYRVRRTLELK